MMPNSYKTIADLAIGQTANIESLDNEEHTCKLLALGIEPGASVSLIRKSPFGGALYVSVSRHYIALRAYEASAIRVKI